MAMKLDHLTETERARSRLDEFEARYRGLVEQLPFVGYSATLDEPSILLYVSPRIESLLGYTPDGSWRECIPTIATGWSESSPRVLPSVGRRSTSGDSCGRTKLFDRCTR